MRLYKCLPFLCVIVSLTIADDIDETEEATVVVVEEQDDEVPYSSPIPSDRNKVYIAEHFDDVTSFERNWVKSAAKKEDVLDADIAKYDGIWSVETPTNDGLSGDKGLVVKTKAKHLAISSKLSRPFVFSTKPLIVQYEVLFQDGQECGGAYLKLLTDGAETKNLGLFHDKTPYTIMFGPDKCGTDHKLHFIFRHVNPRNGTVEEKHAKKPKERIEDFFSDKLPHLYTLIVKPDNSFEVFVDNKLINSGSLLEDFAPPVNPPEEIDDSSDKKPADWDEREKIADPEAVKPEEWDEDAPAQIIDESAVIPDGWLENEPKHTPDPDAVRPDDWDTEMDGDWEAPLIDNPACASATGCGKWEPPLVNNPKYKGKWNAPLMDNPNYKGKWRPRRIPNPNYFEDKHPFKMQSIAAVGFELWTMSNNILFDNLIITEEMSIAEEWAAATFEKKRLKIAKDSTSFSRRIVNRLNGRPGAYALYCVYCMIPIGFYVWYLYSWKEEESIVEKLAKLTNEYPALWAVYILGLALPIVFILYICCKPSSQASKPSTEEKYSAADAKKTDEPTEDDPADEDPTEDDPEPPEFSLQEEEITEELKDQPETGESTYEEHKAEPFPEQLVEARKRKSRKD